jgi:hypothetical protein
MSRDRFGAACEALRGCGADADAPAGPQPAAWPAPARALPIIDSSGAFINVETC